MNPPKLDVTHQQKSLHHNHFHIFMRAPTRADIDSTSNLLAEDDAVEYTQTGVNEEQRVAAQAMLGELQPQLDFNQGDIAMLFMDTPPDVPAMYAPVVIAQASQAQEPAITERTMGVCHLVNSLGVSGRDDPQSPIYIISPAAAVRDYLGAFEKKFFSYEIEIKVTLLQGPEHGTFEMGTTGGRYRPNTNFIGSDRATFLVEIGGLKVKTVYHFKVIDGGAIGGTEDYDKKNCPKGWYWKISTTTDPNGNLIVTNVDNQSLHTDAGSFTTDAATLSTSVLDSLAVDPSAITLNIADLPNGAVSQTTASGITLDTNAAGYNWFIDATPWDNSEFLPTSNPYK